MYFFELLTLTCYNSDAPKDKTSCSTSYLVGKSEAVLVWRVWLKN